MCERERRLPEILFSPGLPESGGLTHPVVRRFELPSHNCFSNSLALATLAAVCADENGYADGVICFRSLHLPSPPFFLCPSHLFLLYLSSPVLRSTSLTSFRFLYPFQQICKTATNFPKSPNPFTSHTNVPCFPLHYRPHIPYNCSLHKRWFWILSDQYGPKFGTNFLIWLEFIARQ